MLQRYLPDENYSCFIGIKSGPKVKNNSKVDIDNNVQDVFDEKEILKAAAANNYESNEDPDATPKLEKKASVSQLISNIKSKFGSASARKKSKFYFHLFNLSMHHAHQMVKLTMTNFRGFSYVLY